MKISCKIKVEFDIPLTLEKDFDIEIYLMEQERKILVILLEDVDKWLSEEYISQGYRVVRTRRRRLKTIFGLIQFRYRVLRKGDRNVAPLLAYLKLSRNQRVSNFLKSLASFVAVEYPYRKVEKIISDMRRVNISHASIRNFLLTSDYKIKRRKRSSHI